MQRKTTLVLKDKQDRLGIIFACEGIFLQKTFKISSFYKFSKLKLHSIIFISRCAVFMR